MCKMALLNNYLIFAYNKNKRLIKSRFLIQEKPKTKILFQSSLFLPFKTPV